MSRRIQLAAALAAVLTLPAVAKADHAHRGTGIFVSIGRGGGVTFGFRQGSGYVNHLGEYLRVERALVDRRSRLLTRTQRALADEDFQRTGELLTRLVEADRQLQDLHDDHRYCQHLHH